MTTPANLTPTTLALIRTWLRTMPPQSVAAQLGWDMARLENTCRVHRIDLSVPIPPASPSRRPSEPGSNYYREVFVGEHSLILARRQANIFDVLWANRIHSRFMPACEISAHCGMTAESEVSTIIYELRRKLRQFGVTIDGLKGPNGGYRMITFEGKAP